MGRPFLISYSSTCRLSGVQLLQAERLVQAGLPWLFVSPGHSPLGKGGWRSPEGCTETQEDAGGLGAGLAASAHIPLARAHHVAATHKVGALLLPGGEWTFLR